MQHQTYRLHASAIMGSFVCSSIVHRYKGQVPAANSHKLPGAARSRHWQLDSFTPSWPRPRGSTPQNRAVHASQPTDWLTSSRKSKNRSRSGPARLTSERGAFPPRHWQSRSSRGTFSLDPLPLYWRGDALAIPRSTGLSLRTARRRDRTHSPSHPGPMTRGPACFLSRGPAALLGMLGYHCRFYPRRSGHLTERPSGVCLTAMCKPACCASAHQSSGRVPGI